MGDLGVFLDELESAAPVPGGGSVAALQAAMAGALIAMVMNLTIGRKRYAAVEGQATAIRDEAGRSRRRGQELIQEDVDAYGLVSKAMALPRETEEDRDVRSAQVQTALKAAVKPPLETMRLAARLLELAAEGVTIGNRSAISDIGTAALAALASFASAQLNVEINLQAIRDESWVADARREVLAIGDPRSNADRVTSFVRRIINGEAA